MTTEKKSPTTTNAVDDKLTLSAALLAPINSLFEVQIQAGRALLNFILQIGFKDKYSKNDIEEEKSKLKINSQNNAGQINLLNKKLEILDNREKYDTLKRKKNRTAKEDKDLENLIKKQEETGFLDEMHNIDFKYFDSDNNEHKIIVPALALVPVEPLAIKSASFDFFMSVESSFENYEQMQPNRTGDSFRPWMFIAPKRIKGVIGSEDSKKTNAGISIKVNFESTPIPQGLSNLLISLTQSSKINNTL